MSVTIVEQPTKVTVADANVTVELAMGKTRLRDLDDVTAAAPAANDVVFWNAASGKFEFTNVATQAELDASALLAPILAPATSARNVIQPSADVVPLTLRGFAGQTARLLERQNSTGAVLSYEKADGDSLVKRRLFFGASESPKYSLEMDGSKFEFIVDSALKFEAQQNLVRASTRMSVGSGSAAYNSASLSVLGTGSADVVVVNRLLAGQTGDLQQWQDSAATTLAKVTAGGYLGIGASAVPTSTHQLLVHTGSTVGGMRLQTTAGNGPLLNFLGPSGQYELYLSGADLLFWTPSSDKMRLSSGGDLTLLVGALRWAAANEQTTVGAAGGASALPATPTKYLKVKGSDGVTYVVPAYAAA